jgi:putative peptidoglycan lipid II flippase
VLAAALWLTAHVASAQFAQWSTMRDEAALGLLIVVGALVYAGVILLLFGPRWLRSLVRG